MTRRVYQMVELLQRRCSLRFGVGACGATGTPKCYQTWATCKFREAFNLDGVYRWRFVPENQTFPIDYVQDGPNDITGHAIPCIKSISRTPTKLNIGAIKKGESPFGIRSTLKVEFGEFEDSNRDGDFYLADRGNLPAAGFWQKFSARIGDAYSQLEARHYVWYEGETLANATVSRFDVRSLVSNRQGASLSCDDPLQRVDARKAQFPRATGAFLQTSINAGTTDIKIALIEDEIAVNYGNTGSRRFLRINKEIIRYTGHSTTGGITTLSGVNRGALGTEADDHEAGDAVQRVGRYERIRMYEAALDLLENHSTITADLIDSAGWESEGISFLPSLRATATITDPRDVNKLIGELARDGLFQTWWDERSQLIKMQSIRPPLIGAVSDISDAANAMATSFDLKPDDRVSRVVIYYNPINPFSTAPENYRVVQLRLDTDAEGPFQADGTIREMVIKSPWVSTEANARLIAFQILRHYSITPAYAKVKLDAKDMALGVESFFDLSTSDDVDPEGYRRVRRWEVISFDPTYEANTLMVEAQESPYIGKFAVIMANDAPDYADATADERIEGCWFAENDGTMPDGSDPYLFW